MTSLSSRKHYKNHKILALILVFAGIFQNLTGQTKGYFINFPSSDMVYKDIKYHTKTDNGIIYLLNTYDTRPGHDDESSVVLIKEDLNRNILANIRLEVDSLRSICAYGENIGEKIQTFCFAVNDRSLYLIYGLYSRELEHISTEVFYISEKQDADYFIYAGIVDKLRTTDESSKVYIVFTWSVHSQDVSVGFRFNYEGKVELFKNPMRSIPGWEWVLLYDHEFSQLVSATKGYKLIFDKNLNFIRKETTYTFPSPQNDTSFYLFNSVLQHNGKNILLGKTNLIYNVGQNDDNDITGRGICEIDLNMKVKGKINFTPVPATFESDGVARCSNSIFYRNGYYYTIFEYQDYNLPFPSETTFFITKFDTLLNIVEEVKIISADHYRFFVEWVDLSEELQYSLSGFYAKREPGQVLLGDYILAFNLDGSQPSLTTKNEMIKAIVRIKGNPISDMLDLSVAGVENTNWQVHIFDLNGRKVKSSDEWHEGNIRIPIQDLPTGTYIYQLSEKGRMVTSGKFVKI